MRNLFAKDGILSLAVVAGALGYFVDAFDIVLVGAVRVPSLKELGVSDDQLMSLGMMLVNTQLVGMLLGGLMWGVLADRFGRTYAMFGSILLYSVASILNAFVVSYDQYLVLRLLGGIGLAGELGPAATLIAEAMPKAKRAYGSSILAALGCLGVTAAAVASSYLDWRTCYIVGGVMGLALLGLRFKMMESGMFSRMASAQARQGDIRLLFTRERLPLYLSCLLLGLPYLFFFWMFGAFSHEVGKSLGFSEPVVVAVAMGIVGVSTAVGDIAAGFLTQYLQSRKKAFYIMFGGMTAGMLGILVLPPGLPAEVMYVVLAAVAFFGGNWALFIMTVTEQFGTNVRGTVATTAANLVRIPHIAATTGLLALVPSIGLVSATLLVSGVVMALGFMAVYRLKETFGKDLDYFEK